MSMNRLLIKPFHFAITQPPGHEPPVAEGEGNRLDDLTREAGHYHRVYMQDGLARLTITDALGEVVLMATGGRRKGDAA